MKRWWWMPVVTLLVSCSGVPRRPAGAGLEIPAQWTGVTNAAAGVALEAWWTALGDSQLDALVAEVLTNNFDLEAAAARLDEALAQARIAGADLNPSLGLGFDATRSQRNFIGFPIPGAGGNKVLTTRSTTFGLNLNSSWELDLWGRIRSGKKAAAADVRATAADLAGTQLSLAAQTVKAWAATLEARRQVDLAESTVTSYRQTADQVRERYQQGVRPPLDLRLALSSLAGAEALLELRRDAEERAIRQLEILLGRYPRGALRNAGDFPSLKGPPPAGLPSELLARRPDVLAAAERLRAADARVAQSKAALLPRISLTASGGTSTEELTDLLDPEFKVWTLAANLAQPIFEGGRLRAGVDLSRARTREALAQYKDAVLRAFSEVESALVSENLLAKRERDLAEAAEQSAAALRLAQLRYQVGLDNFITVLEAQRRSLEADTQWVSVRRARLENRVDLYLALGGGFGIHSDPATARPDSKAIGAEETKDGS
jgi:outer membrane protein, multidrug efflux system